jgi:enamine deaminase RidA (YjgF/YER057c/UK114 family)
MRIDTRTIKAKNAAEIYITALATPDKPAKLQAEELFSGIKKALDSNDARIFQERVFGTPNALDIARSIRTRTYGPLDDGVGPTWLAVPEGINGQLAGAQVYAVGGCGNPEILHLEGQPCGRILRSSRGEYLALSGISSAKGERATDRAQEMFEKADSVLKQAHTDMFSVSRTWIWLGDILSWYDDFNNARNKFFTECGLIGKDSANKLPASTGIGIAPDNGVIPAMDLIAVVKPENSLEYLEAGGNQDSALKYGSAFSRASKAISPAANTVFVSGTASIGADGKTKYIGDAKKQIEESIKNVRAVLREMQCDDNNVVQAIVYCKTAEIEKLFCQQWNDLAWPILTTITDVCRDDLLVEIEATAAIDPAIGNKK